MSEQRLFISHANEDAGVADRIVAYLEAHGVPCWISSRDIPPRAIYADAITAAMQVASGCAVIVSAASNQSKAVKRELELASHYDKPFIPIRIDASEPAAGVDYYLRNTQWVDFKRDGERALDRIVGQMAGAPAARLAPASPPKRAVPTALLLIAGALLVVGVGGWFAWTQVRPPERVEEAAVVDTAPLLGSYKWEGLTCGSGPSVMLLNSELVFTMPGTSTYRHQVLMPEPNPNGGWNVRSRVLAPADHNGEIYVFRGREGSNTVTVSQDGTSDTWERCDHATAMLAPWDSSSEVSAGSSYYASTPSSEGRLKYFYLRSTGGPLQIRVETYSGNLEPHVRIFLDDGPVVAEGGAEGEARAEVRFFSQRATYYIEVGPQRGTDGAFRIDITYLTP